MSTFSYDLLADAPIVDTDSEEAVLIGSGLTDETGEPANQQTAHSAKALGRLIRYFSVGKPRIAAFLAAFTEEVQEAEDLAWAWYATSRDLDTVEGVLLERLGAIVDEARNGRTDTDYRAAIKVKILVLTSDGKTEQLITILTTLITGVTVGVTEVWPARLRIGVSTTGSLTLSYVKALLRQAKGGGVGLDLGIAGGAIGHSSGIAGGAIGHSSGIAGASIGFVV